MSIRHLHALLIGIWLVLWPTASSAANPALSAGAHDVDVGEVKLHYVVQGHGPLLFVAAPGWGASSIYLQNGLKPLETKLTLVYIDMRGSGGSSRPADRARMSQTDMADDIEALRQRLGVDSIDLIGHSDGGTIALEYAERHPEHLRKLVLVAPGILGDREHKTLEATLKLWADDPAYRDAVRGSEAADWDTNFDDAKFGELLGNILPLYVSDPERHTPLLAQSFGDTRLSSFAYHAEQDAAKKAVRDQTRDLGRVRAKTLIINGTVDWVCPHPAALRLQAALPGSRLSLYANKAHVPWIEAPARFFAEVEQFILT